MSELTTCKSCGKEMPIRDELRKLIDIDSDDVGLAELLDILTNDAKDLKLLESLILDEIFGVTDKGSAIELMIDRAEKMDFYLERLGD